MLVEIGEHDPDFETIFDVCTELDSMNHFLKTVETEMIAGVMITCNSLPKY
jgi:hypothetical protein